MQKRLLFFLCLHLWFISKITFCAGGYADTVTLTNLQIATTSNQRNLIGNDSSTYSSGSQNNGSQNCQTSCASTDAATNSLPYFVMYWYGAANSNGQPPLLASFTFPTNQIQGSGGFWVNNAILIVHLFPPSNIISKSAITPINNTTNSYAIMYTLKSLDGTLIQKALQYPNSPLTTSKPVMPLLKGVPQIPTSLAIASLTAPTTPPANPAPTPTLILNPTAFLPTSFSTSSAMTQQRILNAISPFSQKFLINSNSGTLTVTPLSGTFDTNDGATLVTAFSGQSANISSTGGSKLSQLQIMLADSNQNPIQNISLGQNNFTTQDLQNGLALNVHIFPPSSYSSQAQFYAFATLRTLDGLKLHKVLFPAFSTQPAELSINYGSATSPQFSAMFLNSTAAQSSQAIGLISPINLRCLIQKSSSGSLNISML